MTLFFFFNDTATTEIYTLSLHDALPISERLRAGPLEIRPADYLALADDRPLQLTPRELSVLTALARRQGADRKSTRLNSSHANISYAVFCLKKKNNRQAVMIRAPDQPRI